MSRGLVQPDLSSITHTSVLLRWNGSPRLYARNLDMLNYDFPAEIPCLVIECALIAKRVSGWGGLPYGIVQVRQAFAHVFILFFFPSSSHSLLSRYCIDPAIVGKAFVKQYYTQMHKDPSQMHRFYLDQSSFVHGGAEMGSEEPVIGQKVKLIFV